MYSIWVFMDAIDQEKGRMTVETDSQWLLSKLYLDIIVGHERILHLLVSKSCKTYTDC